MHLTPKSIIALSLTLLPLAVWISLTDSYFTIRDVRISGIEHIDPETVKVYITEEFFKESAGGMFSRNNYFLFSEKELQKRLSDKFYIDIKSANKKFPHSIDLILDDRVSGVYVERRTGLALLDDNGNIIHEGDLTFPVLAAIRIADERSGEFNSVPQDYLKKAKELSTVWQTYVPDVGLIRFHLTDDPSSIIVTSGIVEKVYFSATDDLTGQVTRLRDAFKTVRLRPIDTYSSIDLRGGGMVLEKDAYYLSQHPEEMSEPSTTESFEPCDLDLDSDCDETDRSLFDKALGGCINGDNYHRLADADLDGCVTVQDREDLFPTIQSNVYRYTLDELKKVTNVHWDTDDGKLPSRATGFSADRALQTVLSEIYAYPGHKYQTLTIEITGAKYPGTARATEAREAGNFLYDVIVHGVLGEDASCGDDGRIFNCDSYWFNSTYSPSTNKYTVDEREIEYGAVPELVKQKAREIAGFPRTGFVSGLEIVWLKQQKVFFEREDHTKEEGPTVQDGAVALNHWETVDAGYEPGVRQLQYWLIDPLNEKILKVYKPSNGSNE